MSVRAKQRSNLVWLLTHQSVEGPSRKGRLAQRLHLPRKVTLVLLSQTLGRSITLGNELIQVEPVELEGQVRQLVRLSAFTTRAGACHPPSLSPLTTALPAFGSSISPGAPMGNWAIGVTRGRGGR